MEQKSVIITQHTGRFQIESQYASEPRLAVWKGNFRTLVSQKRTGEVALLVRKFLDEVANLKTHQYNDSEQFKPQNTEPSWLRMVANAEQSPPAALQVWQQSPENTCGRRQGILTI